MSSFTRALFEPTGETRGGRAVWRCEGFRYDIGFLGSGLAVVVEEGFETDGPSVPFWAAPFIPVGAMVKSAAVHDKLRADLRFSQLETDLIFHAAMEAEGTPWLAREVAAIAVRFNHNRG